MRDEKGMIKLVDLALKISYWSDAQFDRGQRNRSSSIPISKHLQREAKELTEILEKSFLGRKKVLRHEVGNALADFLGG